MSEKRNRRQFTGEQKAAIVKRHLVDQDKNACQKTHMNFLGIPTSAQHTCKR